MSTKTLLALRPDHPVTCASGAASRFLFLGVVCALAACGPAAGHNRSFTTDWLDDQGKSIAELEARLRSAKPQTKTDLAVAVAGNGDKILGLPLAGGAP